MGWAGQPSLIFLDAYRNEIKHSPTSGSCCSSPLKPHRLKSWLKRPKPIPMRSAKHTPLHRTFMTPLVLLNLTHTLLRLIFTANSPTLVAVTAAHSYCSACSLSLSLSLSGSLCISTRVWVCVCVCQIFVHTQSSVLHEWLLK